MRSSAGRPAGFVRAVLFAVLAAAMAAPVAAQFGGLKKKVKAAAGAPEAKEAQPAGPAAGGGTIVLSDDVINRLIAGLRAGKAYREAAKKENTPYGQYLQAGAAYTDAKAKCDAAAQTYGQRIAADQKLAAKNAAFLEKMIAAQQKQDTALQRAYGDSMLALQDPSCTVKQPKQPDNWNDLQREVDNKAEQEELKASGFDRQEQGAVRDRVEAILHDAPPPDVSQSEKDAVKKQSDELKRLFNIDQPPPPAARAQKPAPAAPPPEPAAAAVPDSQAAMNNCMANNSKKNEKEIIRLGERARAASESGDMPATMAIADSIRRLQMAGCEPT